VDQQVEHFAQALGEQEPDEGAAGPVLMFLPACCLSPASSAATPFF
jgi:hypothetical protein